MRQDICIVLLIMCASSLQMCFSGTDAVEARKQAWIIAGSKLEEQAVRSLVQSLKFSDKGLSVFEDNLAWNMPSRPNFEAFVKAVYDE